MRSPLRASRMHFARLSLSVALSLATIGFARDRVQREIERYCASPGQACSYKVGHSRWLKIREAAGNRLGTKFDLRAFHDAGLAAAPMPMAVLERVMDEWARSQGA